MTDETTLLVPPERHDVTVFRECRIIRAHHEIRLLEADEDGLMKLGSKSHTAGDARVWTIDYDRWLDNTATIEQMSITSSSVDCTAGTITILGHKVTFILTGGIVNETVVLTLMMSDNLGNVKNDTLYFTCVAP